MTLRSIVEMFRRPEARFIHTHRGRIAELRAAGWYSRWTSRRYGLVLRWTHSRVSCWLPTHMAYRHARRWRAHGEPVHDA